MSTIEQPRCTRTHDFPLPMAVYYCDACGADICEACTVRDEDVGDWCKDCAARRDEVVIG